MPLPIWRPIPEPGRHRVNVPSRLLWKSWFGQAFDKHPDEQ